MAALKNRISANLNAFLDTLAVSEGTSTSPATEDDGYDIVVTGIDRKPERFDDYSTHPFDLEAKPQRKPKLIKIYPNKSTLYSSAAGRYQHMRFHWQHYKAELKLPDFSPESQDRWAIQLIRERKALDDIERGDFASAIRKCRNIWASLPGAGYGQAEHSLAALEGWYVSRGGKLA